MKRILSLTVILIIIFFTPSCKNAGKKYFTGTVEYAYTYSSDELNIDSLSKTRPAKGIFRFDENNYQSQFINTDTSTYYYSGRLNKCITAAGSFKKYECEDYGVITDSALAVKEYATEEKVLGRNCRILQLQKKKSWVKYYYTTDLKIAPATYEKHKAYNWDVYVKKAKGGLILQLEHRFKTFTMKGIARAIKIESYGFKALEVNESLFTENCK